MPSNLVINTESTIGYNNSLKKAGDNMKMGVNNEINKDYKNVGAKIMGGKRDKVDRSSNDFVKSTKTVPIKNQTMIVEIKIKQLRGLRTLMRQIKPCYLSVQQLEDLLYIN